MRRRLISNCPSCFGKRAAETEEHLTEVLLPRVPYRQYVLTFPYSLRYRMAWMCEIRTCIDKLYTALRLTAQFQLAFQGHAARRVGGEDRRSLSQLIQYMTRPPIDESRLKRTATGDILYRLKTPWSDGAIGIQLSPSELIEELIALLPPRFSPLVRYGGAFAPNFKRRGEIILNPGQCKRKISLWPQGDEKSQESKVSWSRLLKRAFAIEVSRCRRCGSDLEIIAAVVDPAQIARYLKHVGMPALKFAYCVRNGTEGMGHIHPLSRSFAK